MFVRRIQIIAEFSKQIILLGYPYDEIDKLYKFIARIEDFEFELEKQLCWHIYKKLEKIKKELLLFNINKLAERIGKGVISDHVIGLA